MNKILFFLTIFSLGYIMNDILRENNVKIVGKVMAEVVGMDNYDSKIDYDFKKVVRKEVENYCESDSDGDISC